MQLFPSSKQRLRRSGHLIMNFVMKGEDNLFIYFFHKPRPRTLFLSWKSSKLIKALSEVPFCYSDQWFTQESSFKYLFHVLYYITIHNYFIACWIILDIICFRVVGLCMCFQGGRPGRFTPTMFAEHLASLFPISQNSRLHPNFLNLFSISGFEYSKHQFNFLVKPKLLIVLVNLLVVPSIARSDKLSHLCLKMALCIS